MLDFPSDGHRCSARAGASIRPTIAPPQGEIRWGSARMARALALLMVLAGSVLAGCTTQSQVGITSHINFAPPPATDPEPLVQGAQAIAAALTRGDYVIYMRHGRTMYDQIERERENRANGSFDLDKCQTQRQLSDEGRAELAVAGQQFRLANIPLDGVYSSRYCRAIESAAYFVDRAVATDMLSGEGQVGKDPAQKARTLAFFSMRPAAGRNHFMMAHGGIFWEATGFSVQEGHAVVLDPANLKVIVARVGPAEWGSVAQMRARLAVR
jgi:Histidine phosphatase superfamily (branch 1)